MSIISNVEKYMRRYDYLIEKRERKYKQGKRLSPEEDDELQKLRPNVVTPIFVMFELLHDTIKENQENRKTSKHIINQTGGTQPPLPAATAAATAVAAAATASALRSHTPSPTAATSSLHGHTPSPTAAATPETSERKRLSELEESLLPLLTQIIMYLEENKKAVKESGEEGGGSDEKYPDIGTTAKNSAILVVRRIKKWWNELTSGGTSDLSSKINLKKMIPQLANNPDDMNNLTKMAELNKLADKATDAIHGPLQKIERILSNDVRDIASSSVEGIMNALSLIPGIGTTLQLWRLLQNVIVIMSKSVTTMAETKKEGSIMKEKFQGLQADIENMAANPSAIMDAAANSMISQGKKVAAGAVSGLGSQIQGAGANAVSDMASQLQGAGANAATDMASQIKEGAAGALSGLGSQIQEEGTKALSGALSQLQGEGTKALSGALSQIQGAGTNAMKSLPQAVQHQVGAVQQQVGGGTHKKTNHLRSIKKYKREYKQSIREIRKTRKNILRCIKNMI